MIQQGSAVISIDRLKELESKEKAFDYKSENGIIVHNLYNGYSNEPYAWVMTKDEIIKEQANNNFKNKECIDKLENKVELLTKNIQALKKKVNLTSELKISQIFIREIEYKEKNGKIQINIEDWNKLIKQIETLDK